MTGRRACPKCNRDQTAAGRCTGCDLPAMGCTCPLQLLRCSHDRVDTRLRKMVAPGPWVKRWQDLGWVIESQPPGLPVHLVWDGDPADPRMPV